MLRKTLTMPLNKYIAFSQATAAFEEVDSTPLEVLMQMP
jgi:hypothetical protein